MSVKKKKCPEPESKVGMVITTMPEQATERLAAIATLARAVEKLATALNAPQIAVTGCHIKVT